MVGVTVKVGASIDVEHSGTLAGGPDRRGCMHIGRPALIGGLSGLGMLLQCLFLSEHSSAQCYTIPQKTEEPKPSRQNVTVKLDRKLFRTRCGLFGSASATQAPKSLLQARARKNPLHSSMCFPSIESAWQPFIGTSRH